MFIFIRVAILAATLVFMYLQILFPKKLTEMRITNRAIVFGMLAGGALWLFDLFFIHPYRSYPGQANLALYLLRNPLQSLGITIGLSFAGAMLSKIVKEPNVLLPVALIAMPIDYIGAMTPTGFTQNMMAKHPEIVKHVSVSAPSLHGIAPIAMIGPGDILFIAFFFAIVSNLKLNAKGTFGWMYGLLTLTLLIVITQGVNIAALVPMGIAMIAANYKSFKLQRSEIFASVYVGILVLSLIIGFYIYVHNTFMIR
jgi:hypothetical protein